MSYTRADTYGGDAMGHAVQYKALADGAMFYCQDVLYRKLNQLWAQRPSTGHRYFFWPENLVKPLSDAGTAVKSRVAGAQR